MAKNTMCVVFRVTSEQHRRIRSNAESKGFVTVSAYLRYTALDQGTFLEQKILEIHRAVVKK